MEKKRVAKMANVGCNFRFIFRGQWQWYKMITIVNKGEILYYMRWKENSVPHLSLGNKKLWFHEWFEIELRCE